MNCCPPGLEGSFIEVLSGSNPLARDHNWMPFEYMKLFTNVFVWSEKTGKMLLGYKKRGFGKGLYNGFGGKVKPGETPAQAAVRELKEESGIEAELKQCGILLFCTEECEYAFHIVIFSALLEECQGEPRETEEMRPEWFSLPREYCSAPPFDGKRYPPIPFDKMWRDDRLWMPLLLSRTPFAGRVDFAKLTGNDGDSELAKWWFGTVE